MKNKNTAWTAEEERMLVRAVEKKISAARLSVRLKRSEATIKRRMRELGLIGDSGKQRVPITKGLSELALEWLEACGSRDVDRLVGLYRGDASLECKCDGLAAYVGTGAIRRYWEPTLKSAVPNAFVLHQLLSDGDSVTLDYSSFEGKPVRVLLFFDSFGQIVNSQCGPRGCTLMAA